MDELILQTTDTSVFPEFHESNIAAVKLLQGVVYDTDTGVWGVVLSNRSRLESHFAVLGMILIVDESEGYAYLRPFEESDQAPEGYEKLPKLFQRTRLGFSTTVLCLLLREELRRFDDEQVDSNRCVIRRDDLYELWKSFVPENNNEGKLMREFNSVLKRVEELGFVKRLNLESEDFEIRRIIKARIGVRQLEEIRKMLTDHLKDSQQTAK